MPVVTKSRFQLDVLATEKVKIGSEISLPLKSF